MNIKHNKIILAGLSTALLTKGVLAETINWSRVDSSQGTIVNSDEVAPTFSAATSGSFETDALAAFGFDNNSTTGPATDIQIYIHTVNDGDHITVDYAFDRAIEGGSLTLSGGWQYSDWEVTVHGGTLSTSGISYLHRDDPDGVEGVDYEIFGEGSSTMNFDGITAGSNSGDTGYFFSGSLEVSGEWTGLTISQIHDSSREDSRGLNRKDGAATLSLRNASVEAVPEPSTSLLVLLGAGFGLLRRRR